MTKPHRATPEQWESIERYADTSDPYSCFLELRARIEALEAAQQPQQDKMDRLIAIDRDDPANSPVERIATDTFRALCAELLDWVERASDFHTHETHDMMRRARAALAQPEPVAPSDEDLYDLADVFNGEPVAAMRHALELWGTPANNTREEN